MPLRPSGVITLLTDFGTQDAFVGVMKGVILRIVPHATLVDLTHDVPPQDVQAGMFLLESAYRYFPKGTVHLAVVDPGVGSGRKALAVQANGYFFVAPDNGLLTPVLERAHRVVSLEESRFFLHPVSQSFHGRDIFAPVAAHLARGTPLEAFGPAWASPRRLSLPQPRPIPGGLAGEVVYIDRFGNLITNISEAAFQTHVNDPDCRITVAGVDISGIASCYADKDPGEFLALFTSFGRLEIAQRNGNAAETLAASVGTPVSLITPG